MFQSFRLNRKTNRCLGEGFCSPSGSERCSSFFYCHIKISPSVAAPLLFFFCFKKKKTLIAAMDTFCFATGKTHSCVSLMGGKKKRKNSETLAISFRKILLPFNKLSGAPRLRPGRGHGSAGRNRAGGKPETKGGGGSCFGGARKKMKGKVGRSKRN